MKNNPKCKIGLGSAQWGMDYGISNINGKTKEAQIKKILDYAKEVNIKVIDTASNYGNAEKVIGKYSKSEFKIITKTPHFKNKHLTTSDAELIISKFEQSLKNLKKRKIYCLLVHDSKDLLKQGSENIIKALYELKSKNLIEKIGISIYSNSDLKQILKKITPDLIQLPLNIFDQNLLDNGTIHFLKSKNIEIHARSIFLQGLLLMDDIPNYFLKWKNEIQKWQIFCKNHSKSKLEIALNYVNNLSSIDNLILGVENLNQIQKIIKSLDESQRYDLTSFASNDEDFINPVNWDLNE